MDYQAIDPDDAKDVLLAQHAREAHRAACCFGLDAAAMEFCQVLRFLDGKEADPKLVVVAQAKNTYGDLLVNAETGQPALVALDAAAVALEAKQQQETRDDRLGRMATPLTVKALDDELLVELGSFAGQWEAEHAQHQVHVDLAVSPEKVESSMAEQLRIEGKLIALRKLLAG